MISSRNKMPPIAVTHGKKGLGAFRVDGGNDYVTAGKKVSEAYMSEHRRELANRIHDRELTVLQILDTFDANKDSILQRDELREFMKEYNKDRPAAPNEGGIFRSGSLAAGTASTNSTKAGSKGKEGGAGGVAGPGDADGAKNKTGAGAGTSDSSPQAGENKKDKHTEVTEGEIDFLFASCDKDKNQGLDGSEILFAVQIWESYSSVRGKLNRMVKNVFPQGKIPPDIFFEGGQESGMRRGSSSFADKVYFTNEEGGDPLFDLMSELNDGYDILESDVRKVRRRLAKFQRTRNWEEKVEDEVEQEAMRIQLFAALSQWFAGIEKQRVERQKSFCCCCGGRKSKLTTASTDVDQGPGEQKKGQKK